MVHEEKCKASSTYSEVSKNVNISGPISTQSIARRAAFSSSQQLPHSIQRPSKEIREGNRVRWVTSTGQRLTPSTEGDDSRGGRRVKEETDEEERGSEREGVRE